MLLSAPAVDELCHWLAHAEGMNSKGSLLKSNGSTICTVTVYTDASGRGYGGD